MRSKYFICLYILGALAKLWGQSPGMDQPVFGEGPFLATDQSQWSLYRNTAGIADFDSWQLLTGYHLPYNLLELQSLYLGILIPGKPVMGISIFQAGGDLFRNQQLALNSAIRVKNLSLGLRSKFWRLTFLGLESLHAFSVDFGLQLKLSDRLIAGSFFSNATQTSIGDNQSLPVVWASGIRYQPSGKFLISFEAASHLGSVLELKLGLEYLVKDKLGVRSGFSSLNKQSYFGLTFQTLNFELEYAISLHLALGVVHQAGLSFSWS